MRQEIDNFIGFSPMYAVDRISALFETGGPIMVILAGFSVLALTVVVFKGLQFAYYGLWRHAFVDTALKAWHQGDPMRALDILSSTRHPIARTMERAIRGKRDGKVNRRDLEDDTARDAALHIARLRSFLRVLELIATLSPLLGLLGTVLGMIDAFQALEAAGNQVNPAILSGGIWVALLTTAAGLIVAIPAAASANLIEGIVERITQRMEDVVTQILTDTVPGDATQVASDTTDFAAGMAL
jgi:biopolymer transport protein ExbB